MVEFLEHKLFFKNTLSLSVANMIKIAFGALVMILLARMLGTADFGKLTFSISFVSLFIILSDLGLSSYSIVSISADRGSASRLVNSIIPLKLILSAVSFLLIYLTINVLGYPQQVKVITYLFGIAVLVDSFIDLICSAFRGIEKMKYEALISLIQYGLLFLAIAILLKIGARLELICLVWALLRAVALFISLEMFEKIFGEIRLSWDFKLWNIIIKNSYFFGLYIFLASIYNKINIVILSKAKGDVQVGFYQAALNILIFSVFLLDNLLSAFLPLISRRFKEGNGDFKKLVYNFNKLLFFLMFPIVCFVYVFAGKIALFCYARQIYSVVVLLQFLCLAYMFQYAPPSGLVFLATGKQKICFYVSLCCATVNVIANFIFIPLYGAKGAAAVFIFTYLLMRVLYLFAYKRSEFYVFDLGYLVVMFVSVALSVIMRIINFSSLILTFGLYSTLYAAICYFLILNSYERSFYFDLALSSIKIIPHKR